MSSDPGSEAARRHYLELSRGAARDMVLLEGDRMTLGRHPDNDVTLTGDDRTSRVHAALEKHGAGWCLTDLGSRNGTYVNGERILGNHLLRHGDEVKIGSTRLRFQASSTDDVTETAAQGILPVLTRREREVLVALCRPALAGGVLPEPASTRSIAVELGVGEDAVKQHLLHLYAKFAIEEAGGARRVRLAKAALVRGAVTRADVRRASPPRPTL